MKESALLALEYIRAHSERIGIDNRIFDNYNLHVHVPEDVQFDIDSSNELPW